MERKYTILSIDAWNGPDGWTWNNWFRVGECDAAFFESNPSTRKLLRYMRAEGYLGEGSKGRVYVEDDGYNIVVRARCNHEPLFAIEYGSQV